MNPTRVARAIHYVRLFLALQINRSEGSQRAPRGGESLVIRVKNNYRSILNAYDAGREAETLLSSLDRSKGSQRVPRGGESLVARVASNYSILNAYDAGREAFWIHLGFSPATRVRIASYLTPDTTRRCESIIPLACHLQARASRARDGHLL
jgi:hypothetical protein